MEQVFGIEMDPFLNGGDAGMKRFFERVYRGLVSSATTRVIRRGPETTSRVCRSLSYETRIF